MKILNKNNPSGIGRTAGALLCMSLASLLSAPLAADAAPANDNEKQNSAKPQTAQSVKEKVTHKVPWQAVYIPLDDRPCNNLFPAQIARIGGGELLQPDRVWLGRARTPGSPEHIKNWLKNNAPGRDCIISADMLAYGGLLASRTCAVNKDAALDNIAVLRELAAQNSHLEILAVLPRLSLRTSDVQAPYEEKLRNWAVRGESAPPAGVPSEVFAEYTQVRSRNCALIGALIDMTAEGVIDHLIIGQDDASAKGIHIAEITKLKEKINRLHISSKVDIMCGADELGTNMTAGWLSRKAGYTPHIEFDYSDPAAKEKIPPLESFTLAETARRHLKISGAEETSGTGTVLFIETPDSKPYAAPNPDGTEQTRAQAADLLKRIGGKFAGSRTRPYGIADLHLVNRAEPIFAQTIIDNIPIWDLSAYSAWNTPSNSLGTAIAQACAQQIAIVKGYSWSPYLRLESEKTQQAFTTARLIDDYAYQAVIRQNLTGEYKNIKLDADPLLNQAGPAGLEARSRAIPWANNLWNEKLKGRVWYSQIVGSFVSFKDMKLEIVLPWPRLFEIEERLNITVIPVENDSKTAKAD